MNSGQMVRWERAVASIRFRVGITGREYETSDVIAGVDLLAGLAEGVLQVVGDAIWAELKSSTPVASIEDTTYGN